MASEMLNPGFNYPGKKVQITYDTADSRLTKDNTTAEARIVSNGVQFEFTGNAPGKHYPHTSGVIPSTAVDIKDMTPKRTFDSGNVKVLYDIEVTDKDAFESNF